MKFTIIDAPQRSEAWFAARAGRVTGSVASDMLAKTQKGWAASRKNLLARLVLERVTNKPQESGYQSQAMLDGIAREEAAFDHYQSMTGNLLARTGFLSHADLMAGCSLDGHVGEFEGIVEAKSPIPATHLEYLKSGKVPKDYADQVLHNLWMTGAQWCDWFSYHPDFPPSAQMKLVRIERDEKAIQDYDAQIRAFLAEVEVEVAALRTLIDLRGALTGAA